MAFAHVVAGGNDYPLGPLNDTTHIGFEFDHPYFVVIVNGVDFTIVVKKYRKVVNLGIHGLAGPWAFGIPGSIDYHAVIVHIGKNVKQTVVVTDAGCPDALTIGLFATGEVEFAAERQRIEGIAAEVPVDQIFGMQYNQAWHTMHGCTGQVEIASNPYDVGIGKLIVKKGVGIGSVSVVCRPGGILCDGMQKGNGKQQGKKQLFHSVIVGFDSFRWCQ
eukprot:TRINITY_DN26598_c0_g1_i1.p2 TRINITY_DN26598_c0_g1~~TRINITY_DN26598_c0_g1_i1.p2  ORF type:complete len:218 (-),score=7.37 TRINITY_DN26598_c0_g1_i1:333-986(-)